MLGSVVALVLGQWDTYTGVSQKSGVQQYLGSLLVIMGRAQGTLYVSGK